MLQMLQWQLTTTKKASSYKKFVQKYNITVFTLKSLTITLLLPQKQLQVSNR